MGGAARNCKRYALRAEEEATSTSLSLSKRRKPLCSRELQESGLVSPDVEVGKNCVLSNSQDKPATVATSSNSGRVLAGDIFSSICSGEVSASRCASNDSLRALDLEAKSFETEISTSIDSNKFSREKTPLSELCADSEEMESPEKKPSPSPEKPPKTPPQAEINEFFSQAEKYEQKRFAEKYNFDIVNDVPLEGRYQWIRLKP